MASSIFDIDAFQAAAAQACALLKVFVNPDRLFLLCVLSQGELWVSDLESETGNRRFRGN